MAQGTIITLSLTRGFGFIRPVGGSADAFFHADDLQGGLEFDASLEERFVEFDVIQERRGPRASNVRAT